MRNIRMIEKVINEDGVREELQEMMEVPKEDYYALIEIANWSKALQEAGVDNWEGIDQAYEIYGEIKRG